jgi:outer membrane receptor for ferrienterochelin and colicin
MVDKINFAIKYALVIILLLSAFLYSQTTGKIAGTVVDAMSGDPLIGANVIVSETHLGAAVSADGSYFIINVSPGTYTIKVQMMGYEIAVFNSVRVSVNRTTELNAKLNPSVIEGTEVVVTASAMEIKKDQTSSVRNVSSETMENLPIESVSQVVNMQAGVVAGHFRGGRNTEVSFMIDGIQVDEAFTGTGSSINLEAESVEDLEVITGTFNAEYGRAMSGVVNAVTKEGSNTFHGAASVNYADYMTPHDDVFIGINSNPTLNISQDYKLQLEGPIVRDKLSFFVNYRHQNIRGHLNGVRRFNPWDYSDFTSDNPDDWHIENTGDNEYVSMSWANNASLLAKLAFKPLSNLRITGLYTLNDDEGQGYSHGQKYNPDGRSTAYKTSYMYAFNLNHMISPSLFYEMKINYVNNSTESYLYNDPLDERYLHPRYGGTGQTGFSTGGNASPGRGLSLFQDINYKYDITWQATSNHSLKAGLHYIDHHIDQDAINVRNMYSGLAEENISVMDSTGKVHWPFYKVEVVPHTERTMGIYKVDPWELSGYLQDKLEYDDMVINLGVRYDYFNPDQVYPTDRRNPSNQLNLPDSMMTVYEKAEPQTQLSPRFGLAYQLGEAAILRFSYGHFFQMPPMYSLYENNIFRVPVNDFGTTMGNAQLHPQKTVSYEIGIWQELLTGMGLEIALFYKDIYDLLSTRIISTYNQIEYGLYTNKDYGNARGLEVKWDFGSGGFNSNVNYTLQYTKGNADNPRQTFTRAGSSMDPIKRFIPMSWDQRHTFNATAGYRTKNYGATLTGYYNSGTPYSFAPLPESPLSLINLYMNNDYKPSGFKVDLTAFYNIKLSNSYKARLTLTVYNLLDRLNTVWVYSDTGQAYTTIVREAEIAAHHSNFNDYDDRVHNPTAYSAPRQIKLGLGFVF